MLSPSLTQIFLPSLVTARNSSCGKVIFSQACVIPSVHGGGGGGVAGVYPSMQWGRLPQHAMGVCIPACNGARGVCPEGVCPGEVSAQGCVCPGGCLPWGCVFPGVCLPRGVSAMGVCLPRGCLPSPGTNIPSETATEAGGTHPTEMHSCFLLVLTWVIDSK